MTHEQWLHVWIIFTWVTLFGFVISWPLTAMTVFKHEPQGILGLSFLALIITALGNLIAVYIFRKVDPESS